MEFEAIVENFAKQYLVPRGLQKEIFGFRSDFGGAPATIIMPNDAVVVWEGQWLCCSFECGMLADKIPCDMDELMDAVAKQYAEKQ